MDKKAGSIAQIFKLAESVQEYLKIVKAFLKGYEAFIYELKNGSNESEN